MRQNNINPNSSGVGDPAGFSPNVMARGGGGAGAFSAGGISGGRAIQVTLGPIYVQGTQADANNIASMVAAAIKTNPGMQEVANS